MKDLATLEEKSESAIDQFKHNHKIATIYKFRAINLNKSKKEMIQKLKAYNDEIKESIGREEGEDKICFLKFFKSFLNFPDFKKSLNLEKFDN